MDVLHKLREAQQMALYVPNQNNRFNHALQFATMAHGNQVRKGNEHIPYILHPIDVSRKIITFSGLPVKDLSEASVKGLLHDTKEDTVVTFDDLLHQFGELTAVGILLLSKDATVAKEDQFEENLDRLATAPQDVQCVKMADRISNLETFPRMWDRDKIDQYLREGTQIADVLGRASETLRAHLLMSVAKNREILSLREAAL